MSTSSDRETDGSDRRELASDRSGPGSDVGTMPPSAEREAQPDHAAGMPLFKANPSLSPGVRIVEPADETGLDRSNAGAPPPEAAGTNPLTLSPDDPQRESAEGQPYLDDANPYGRPLVNRQNRPMGGIGAAVDPNDRERPLDRTDPTAAESQAQPAAALQGGQTMIDDALLTPDQRIARAIEDAIQARLQSDAPPINVAVQGATVTLTGHVANQATKDAINAMARNTEGVINVTDNLVVGKDRSFLDWFRPARDENQDLERADSSGEM